MGPNQSRFTPREVSRGVRPAEWAGDVVNQFVALVDSYERGLIRRAVRAQDELRRLGVRVSLTKSCEEPAEVTS